MPKTFNESEVEKFSSIADQWWDKNGKFKVLHNFNTPRVEFIQSLLQKEFANIDPKKIKVLDIGCGGGILSEALYSLNLDVTGIDASEKTIAIAKEHALQNGLNINYINCSYEDITIDTKFDIVFAMEIIEHVDNPKEFVKTICQYIKPNGIVVISTINRNLKSLFLAKFMVEYVLKWLPKNTHSFSKFITPTEMQGFLNNENFEIIKYSGITYDLFSKKWNLSNSSSTNYVCYGKKY